MRTGFTLIEIIVVVLILAIAAGAVTINLSGPLARAKFQEATTDVAGFLTFARHSAVQNNGPIDVILDIDANVVVQKPVEDLVAMEKRLKFSKSLCLRRVIGKDFDVSSGRVTVRYTAKGLSDSYAMMFADRRGNPHWLFVSGLTGQIAILDDETSIRHIFEAIRQRSDVG